MRKEIDAVKEAQQRLSGMQHLLPPSKHLKKGEILEAITTAVFETNREVAVRMMLAIAKKLEASRRDTEAELARLFGEKTAAGLLWLLDNPEACITEAHKQFVDDMQVAA